MNLNLSEDEKMLQALAERFVQDHYDIEKRRTYLAEPNGYSPKLWALLSELGLIPALFAESDGGGDLDATGIAVVFEAMGRGLAVEPLAENVLLAGRLFAATADAGLRDTLLPQIVEGSQRVALAHAEAKGRGGRLWIETTAEAKGADIILTGEKAYVPAGMGADHFIVSARTENSADSPSGAALYLVPANAPGLTVTPWRMVDGAAAASLKLDRVKVGAASALGGGVEAIARAQTLANLARAAEALGIMERIFAETSDYLRTREQFGVTLSSFQALQHRMVQNYLSIEQSRALINLALVSWKTPEFEKAVLGARAFISDASIALGHDMMQFHGGMGVTDELLIGQGHKRLLVLSRWPDDPDVALDRFAGIA